MEQTCCALLDYKTLKHLFKTCSNNPFVSAAVVFDNMYNLVSFVDWFWDNSVSQDTIEIQYPIAGRSQIAFRNGSVIYIVRSEDVGCVDAQYYLCSGESVYDDIRRTIANRSASYGQSGHETAREDSTELNEFLASFKITGGNQQHEARLNTRDKCFYQP